MFWIIKENVLNLYLETFELHVIYIERFDYIVVKIILGYIPNS